MSEISSPGRAAAAYVLGRCRRFDAWSAQTFSSAVGRYDLDERETSLCARLCRSALQNAALCDFYIGYYSARNPNRLEPQVLDILRLGICQLLFMDRIPASAAVDESVKLARRSVPRAAGLVNAVLRRLAREKDALPDIPGQGSADWLSVRYSHPLWLCRRMCAENGYEFTETWLRSNNQEPPLTVTMNPLRGAERAESAQLERSGDVRALPGYKEGRFFVQDAAAAEAVKTAAPTPGMRVLDGCAAPGGKSFLAAMLMENRGDILACDLHEKKLSLVEAGAKRLGIDILRTRAMDAAHPHEDLLDGFDLVLADVPCSGLGVIRRKPEIRYKPEETLARLPEIQLSILRGLSRCVRSGGTLLYSTCTVLPEENSGVVRSFLAENGDFTMETENTLWPHLDGTDGFYRCRMRKNA